MTRPPSDALPTVVYEQLRRDIISGKLADGQRLVGTRLADELKVSRTPVREALKLLTYDGLVESYGDGVRVVTRTAEQLFDLYEVRIPLEAAAATAAATRSKDFETVQLQRLSNAMKAVSPNDRDAVVAANRDFHQYIWSASHNAPLIGMLNRLELYLTRYPQTAFEDPERLEHSIAEHEGIVEAIRNRDVERAHALTQQHFTNAREIRLERFSETYS